VREHSDPVGFARHLMNEIALRCRIPSTAGIGTNLYLAKIALDITAKHSPDHVGFLDEDIYRGTLWDHRPITDFWMVAAGTANRLAGCGIYDMRGVAQAAPELLYRLFGRNAELLIDHAWGREPCLISDIKRYRPKTNSVSFTQILPRDYTRSEGETVMAEMARNGADELVRRGVATSKISIFVAYSREALPPSRASARLGAATCLASVITDAAVRLYRRTACDAAPVRRLGIAFENVCRGECVGYDVFTDPEAAERELRLRRTVIGIRDRYGRNAVLSGTDFLPEGTQRERNGFIGGHRAGYDDKRGKS
ncbi:MAG: DNA repair protein, partial [Clostridia bacterium]|nr:DNA repair protein [Clostridia bacterium]